MDAAIDDACPLAATAGIVTFQHALAELTDLAPDATSTADPALSLPAAAIFAAREAADTAHRADLVHFNDRVDRQDPVDDSLPGLPRALQTGPDYRGCRGPGTGEYYTSSKRLGSIFRTPAIAARLVPVIRDMHARHAVILERFECFFEHYLEHIRAAEGFAERTTVKLDERFLADMLRSVATGAPVGRLVMPGAPGVPIPTFVEYQQMRPDEPPVPPRYLENIIDALAHRLAGLVLRDAGARVTEPLPQPLPGGTASDPYPTRVLDHRRWTPAMLNDAKLRHVWNVQVAIGVADPSHESDEITQLLRLCALRDSLVDAGRISASFPRPAVLPVLPARDREMHIPFRTLVQLAHRVDGGAAVAQSPVVSSWLERPFAAYARIETARDNDEEPDSDDEEPDPDDVTLVAVFERTSAYWCKRHWDFMLRHMARILRHDLLWSLYVDERSTNNDGILPMPDDPASAYVTNPSEVTESEHALLALELPLSDAPVLAGVEVAPDYRVEQLLAPLQRGCRAPIHDVLGSDDVHGAATDLSAVPVVPVAPPTFRVRRRMLASRKRAFRVGEDIHIPAYASRLVVLNIGGGFKATALTVVVREFQRLRGLMQKARALHVERERVRDVPDADQDAAEAEMQAGLAPLCVQMCEIARTGKGRFHRYDTIATRPRYRFTQVKRVQRGRSLWEKHFGPHRVHVTLTPKAGRVVAEDGWIDDIANPHDHRNGRRIQRTCTSSPNRNRRYYDALAARLEGAIVLIGHQRGAGHAHREQRARAGELAVQLQRRDIEVYPVNASGTAKRCAVCWAFATDEEANDGQCKLDLSWRSRRGTVRCARCASIFKCGRNAVLSLMLKFAETIRLPSDDASDADPEALDPATDI
ncbi:hypothetical protein H9P43_002832 [Blastocladiella emersonii ATCC 22665]|nr:hypothetical protein H9P43_002832 [Blastocladiella emersonii ATCC 22665]